MRGRVCGWPQLPLLLLLLLLQVLNTCGRCMLVRVTSRQQVTLPAGDVRASSPHAPATRACLYAPTHAAAGRLQDFLSGLHERVWFSFIPRKEDVTEDYWEWLKWRLGQVRCGRMPAAVHARTSPCACRPACLLA
jgi:hypothetical protein